MGSSTHYEVAFTTIVTRYSSQPLRRKALGAPFTPRYQDSVTSALTLISVGSCSDRPGSQLAPTHGVRLANWMCIVLGHVAACRIALRPSNSNDMVPLTRTTDVDMTASRRICNPTAFPACHQEDHSRPFFRQPRAAEGQKTPLVILDCTVAEWSTPSPLWELVFAHVSRIGDGRHPRRLVFGLSHMRELGVMNVFWDLWFFPKAPSRDKDTGFSATKYGTGYVCCKE